MKDSAGRGECYPPRPKAEVDNTFRDLQNSSYPTKAPKNSRVRLPYLWGMVYNGSYTMATEPIKFLELNYTMTQFLIRSFISCHRRQRKGNDEF